MKEERRARGFDLISFDIFDTLITRNVLHPTDLFTLVGHEILGATEEAIIFRDRRVEAESNARAKSESGEVCLKDIYRELFSYYGIKAAILKDCEIKAEKKSCHPREKWVRLFHEYVKSGKRVVLISDMYLSSDVIKDILTDCGISGYSNIYISNECGCDKVSGKLYEIAEEKEGLKKCRHIHYGDSIRADYMGARKAGVTPRLVLKEKWLNRLLRKCVGHLG